MVQVVSPPFEGPKITPSGAQVLRPDDVGFTVTNQSKWLPITLRRHECLIIKGEGERGFVVADLSLNEVDVPGRPIIIRPDTSIQIRCPGGALTTEFKLRAIRVRFTLVYDMLFLRRRTVSETYSWSSASGAWSTGPSVN
ncbi:hypothetical protein [Phenylobacterium sp.]|uniref:hypothetical protein n=1 Tax=Phenylobacterium sp. TaxID=1871053 RepID=UPI0025DAF029|nr:hypothetical protein [Phenylobacterium sp.]